MQVKCRHVKRTPNRKKMNAHEKLKNAFVSVSRNFGSAQDLRIDFTACSNSCGRLLPFHFQLINTTQNIEVIESVSFSIFSFFFVSLYVTAVIRKTSSYLFKFNIKY
jgi:hypothetical protein